MLTCLHRCQGLPFRLGWTAEGNGPVDSESTFSVLPVAALCMIDVSSSILTKKETFVSLVDP